MNKLYFDKRELKDYFESFVEKLIEEGVPEEEINERVSQHYTNKVIKVYSRAEQDKMWEDLMYLIHEVPGGYWQLIENMDYMPEFEHYRFKCLKSAGGNKGSRSLPKHL